MASCNMLLSALVLFGAISPALAHMEMSWPYPIRSPFNPANNYTDIDYSYMDPLNYNGSNFPCKGYQNDRPILPVVTYEAGSTYNMTIYGTANHGGGSCQLSLSYDNGATFRVIKSMIGGCPLTLTYDFTIPSYAPDGTALLAWTWFNLIGNREIYMDCAEVNIDGSKAAPKARKRQAKTRRDQFTSFDQLPYIWKANVPGINTCATVENVTPVFPDPGPDVQYGAGFSSSSPPTTGDCDSPTPYGAAYEDLHDTGPGIYAPGENVSPLPPLGQSTAQSVPIISTTASSPLVTLSSVPATTTPSSSCEPSTVTVTATEIPKHAPKEAFSDRLRPIDPCQTFTVTVFSTKEASSTKTPAHSKSPPKATSSSKPERTHSSKKSPPPTSTKAKPTHTHAPTSTATPQPATTLSTSTTSMPAPTATNVPGFATGPSLAAYLPCVANTYLCTSNTTYAQCVGTSDTATGYIDMGSVSAGMTCQPYSAPLMQTTPAGVSTGGGMPGTYRNDRIVQAQPFGPCSAEGQIECVQGGAQFLICNQGGWVDMGAVAAGTVCQGSPGVIGAAAAVVRRRRR